MRFSRNTLAALSLAFGATGCAGLLGLDDFTEGESSAAGTESASSTEAGPGPGSGGSGPGTGDSSASTQSGPVGPGGGGTGGEGGGPTGPLDVTPGEPKVGILRGLQFEANREVTWSVEESDGGSIDAEGFYISPAEPGDGPFHVVATDASDESVTQTVEVTVVGLNAVVVGGIPGGSGNIDGAARKARFDRPNGMARSDNGSSVFVADSSNHTIREWDEDTNSVTTLAGKAGESGTADGPGTDARFNRPTSLVVGSRIWVLDSDNHCIRSITPSTGATTTLAGECGTAGNVDGANGTGSRFDFPQQMVLSRDGSMLFVCQSGGTRSIRGVNTTTGETDTLVSGLSSGCALATDHWRSVIYFHDFEAGNYVIRQFADPFTVASVTTVAVLPAFIEYFDAMAALTGFGNEDDIYFARTDYVDDEVFARIYRYNIGDDQFFPDPVFGDERGYVDGEYAEARLTGAIAMVGDPGYGRMYFTDQSADSVRRVDINNEEVETFLGPAPNIDPVDGPKSVARLVTPVGLALDGEGFAYETNFGETDNTVRRIDLATGEVSTFAGTSGELDDEDIVDGLPGTGKFGIATDIVYLDGQLYVTDLFGNAVRRVDGTTGEITTIAGELLTPGFTDGVGAAARFRFSEGDGIGGGITTDGTDLYVCDTGNFAIRRVDVSTGTVTTVAGGTQGSSDGFGDAAQFVAPAGIAFLDGSLYVTDFIDATVRMIDLDTSEVTTLAGRPGEIGEVDGGPGVATFTTPFRVIADGIGNLYVSEVEGNVIRRISLDDGQTSHFLGTSGQRGVNPAPFPTTLNCPTGMAVMGRGGDLVFADACDGVIMQAKPL